MIESNDQTQNSKTINTTTQRRLQSLGEPHRDKLNVSARRCILVRVMDQRSHENRDQAFDEIRGLVETAGSEVVGTLLQVREKPDSATYIGKGKVEELSTMLAETKADLIVFDNYLTPSQGKQIETITNSQVVDRSEVILDIFATHARSAEAKLQVELAQLLYMRPRLTRMWTHLERITGGIGSGKGPGEKQLETDKRLLDTRISELRGKIAIVEKRREQLVADRNQHITVSLVGYTNAGKSTLMNALTGADVYVADQLFATLDTRTRKWSLPHWGAVLLSDTVGFIRDLPHHLVASFRSTLAEARHADLLLHVVDCSHHDAQRQIETVNKVLKEMNVDSNDAILVLNKVDAAKDRSLVDVLRARYPKSITVSAKQLIGIDNLQRAVCDRLADGYIETLVESVPGNGRVYAYLSEHAEVLNTEYENGSVVYQCRIPKRFCQGLMKVGATITNLNGSPIVFESEKEIWWKPSDDRTKVSQVDAQLLDNELLDEDQFDQEFSEEHLTD